MVSRCPLPLQEKRLLRKWQDAANPPQVFVICNQVDRVEVDPNLIEREEAAEIMRKHHPGYCNILPEADREYQIKQMLDRLSSDPAEVDRTVRVYKKPNLAPIEENVLGTLRELF